MVIRDLLDYLPPYMQKYLEMQKIMGVEQPEIRLLWEAAEAALNDQFIWDATEYGVSRWEGMLGICPRDTDTLDERKFRIWAKLNQELPYTYRALEKALTNLCGEGGFTILLDANAYTITIRLALANEIYYDEVKSLLKRMIPANLVQIVTILYNTHRILKPFKHSFLATKTYDQVRKEELPDA